MATGEITIDLIYGYLSVYMNIPFPEQLPDELVWQKWQQLRAVTNKPLYINGRI